jgi:hypothetical protein
MKKRRDFHLPLEDTAFLNTLGTEWETISSQGMQWLLLHSFPIIDGYNVSKVIIAFKIESGYPRIGLDMVYFSPSIFRTDGVQISAITSQVIDDKQYQRWSRHRTAINPWREDVDNISTHLSMVSNWLEREFTINPSPYVTRI